MNEPEPSSQKLEATEAAGPILLFSNTKTKLILLSVVTFGIYELYWSYKNWKAIKEMDSRDISPFWRSWFILFYGYYLFKTILEKAEEKGFKSQFTAGALATIYISLLIAGNLSGKLDGYGDFALLSNILWFVSYFTVFPMLELQKAVNAHNRAIDPAYMPYGRMSGWDVFFVIAGGLTTLLGVIGTIFY